MALTIAMVALISSASATHRIELLAALKSMVTLMIGISLPTTLLICIGLETNKDVESKLYLRYNCSEKVMYALVLEEDPAQALEWADDAWIAINGYKTRLF